MKIGMIAFLWSAIAGAALVWFASQPPAQSSCVHGSAAQIFTHCAGR